MANPEYLSCTVKVVDEHQLIFTSFIHHDTEPVSFGDDPLTWASIKRLSQWVEDAQHYSNEDLKLLGRHLYRHMFGDDGSPVHQRFQEVLTRLLEPAYRNSRLRLTLEFNEGATALASLPWEFLYGEDDARFFFSAHKESQLVLTRTVPPPAKLVESLEPDDSPLRILVAVCSPTGGGLAEVSAANLLPKLSSLRSEKVEVKILENPQLAEIQSVIGGSEAKGAPHIFHFIGHGDVNSEGGIVAIKASDKELERHVIAGEGHNEVEWIPTPKLIELFLGTELPRLVFLHACRGAKPGSFSSFASGAEEFVKAGALAAIAMRYSIGTEDAESFALTFYEALSQGRPVDDAVTSARVKLATAAATSWGDRRFGTPMLYLQSTNAIILRPVTSRGQQQADGEAPDPRPEGRVTVFDCPGFLTDERTGKRTECPRLITRKTSRCQVCGVKPIWCPDGHPNLPGDKFCGYEGCELGISEAAPTRSLKAVSGFG